MEKPLQLCYPVLTLDRRELLPAGSYITQDTMDNLVRSAKREKFAKMRFMEYGTIAKDIHNYCLKPPYGQIFSNPKRKSEVFHAMERMEFVQPLLDIFGYFKANDPYTYRHILMVYALSLLLAQDLIADRRELAIEASAAPNHDFGKICVPLSVCVKSTPLNDHERQLLSHHAAAGYVLLSYYLMDHNHPAAVTARDHHERLNGSGYPRGIALQNRFVEIVAVGDIFDALICARPYRRGSYELRTALEEITQQAENGSINEDVVHALINCNRETRTHGGNSEFSHEHRGAAPPNNHYRGVIPCHFQSECLLEDGEESDADKGDETSPGGSS